MNFNIFSKYRNQIYGISIISIIIFHFFDDYCSQYVDTIPYKFGHYFCYLFGNIGVEWFLFMSGICLFFSLSKDTDILSFYRKRLKKILIPYIIVALSTFAITDIFMKKSVTDFFMDFFFVSFFTKGENQFWYVLFILLAYLVYPVFFFYQRKCNKYTKPGVYVHLFMSCFVIIVLHHVFASRFPALYSNTQVAICRILIFNIGCYAGYSVYHKEKITPIDVVGFNVGFIYIVIRFIEKLSFLQNQRFAKCLWSLTSLYWITICLDKIKIERVQKFLSWVGQMSLEIYLTHVAIRRIFNVFGFYTYHFYFYLLCIAISVLLSILIVRLEKHLASAK